MGKLAILFLVYLFVLSRGVLAHSEVSVVEMTPNGFEPQSIEVDENSSVIFINKDKEARWPASNVHPTHELYPEFDPKKPIQPGESWPFKANKIGEWKFHDHLFPHMRGVIKVSSEKGIVKSEKKAKSFWEQAVAKVKHLLSQLSNLVQNLRKINKQVQLPDPSAFIKFPYDQQQKILKDLKAEEAWEFVKTTFKGQGGSSGNIHDLAHLSGILMYEQNGFKGIKNCSPEFSFGCYHGFLDKAFEKNLDLLSDAHNACLTLGSQGLDIGNISGPVASCIHGIGHGVASFYSTADLKKSLTSCRKLTSGGEYCFDGVFMEFVRSAPESFFKKDDPLYPCNALEKEFGYAYSFSCGRNQPSLLMSRFNKQFDEVVGICLGSGSKQFKGGCFDSLGFSIASGGDVEKIIQGCQSIGTQDYVIRCVKASAGELVFQEVPGWYEKSQDVCNAFISGRESCLEHVERLIKEYNRPIKHSFVPRKDDEDVNIYLRDTLRKCYETDGRDGCYKDAAEVLYKQFGLSATLKTLNANENYPEVYARCHEVTHYLSRFEYEKQEDISKVYAQCDSTCHGGCYHGTLEAYLKGKNLDENDLKKEFVKVCGKREDHASPLVFNECFHGLGHAAMFVTDMDLLASLSLCDGFMSQNARDRCLSGIFMENSSSSTSSDHKSRFVKAEDPFYPCNSLEEKYLTICWRYQSSYFSIILNNDWPKVVGLCLKVPDQYQGECFRTIGTNQVGFTQDPQVMKANCELAPGEDFQMSCIIGVVASFAYRFVGDASKMIDFCSLVSGESKKECFKQIGASFSDWTSDKEVVKAECRKIPDGNGQDWCLSMI